MMLQTQVQPRVAAGGSQDRFLERFARDGAVVTPPGVVFTASQIEEIARLVASALPAWSDGVVDPLVNDSHTDPRFDIAVQLPSGVELRGCALRHRFYRGHGSIESTLDDNFLYGKRATLDLALWPRELFAYIGHVELGRLIAGALGCADVSLRNGLIAATFPGYTGESRQYHIDTPDFARSSARPLVPDACVLNVFVLLSDADTRMPVLRVIRGSHVRYPDVNEALSRALKRPSSRNNAHRQVWEELLPDGLEGAETVRASRGSVILVHGNALHAAAENATRDGVSTMMLLQFAPAGSTTVLDNLPLDRVRCRRVIRGFCDRKLVAEAFLPGARLVARERARQLRRRVNSFVEGGWKDPIRPAYYWLRRRLTLARNKPLEAKQYLNIGAGVAWRHPEVICLDHSLPNAEIALDLNYSTRLPFDDERFLGVYVSHCLEHLKERQVGWWVNEVRRVLKPGGVFRIISPDIAAYLDAYDAKDASYFDWIRGRAMYRYDSWIRLIVRMFAEPVVDNYSDDELIRLYRTLPRPEFLEFFSSQVERVEDERLLDPSCHKSWWSGGKMCRLLLASGFTSASVTTQLDSACPVFRGKAFNRTRPSMSFFVEGIK